MKNQLLSVSLKFGIILGGVSLLFGLISTLTFNSDNPSSWSIILLGILNWVILITVIAMAHYEYNRKNENYISFKDAIQIGLIIIGIAFLVSTVYTYINYEFLMKEKMQALNSNMNEKYGTLSQDLYSTKTAFLSSLAVLFVQVVVLFLTITMESHWKIYSKAGQKGWASLVPFYNIIVLLDIVRKPSWWLILLFIPFINIIFAIWMTNLLSLKFGKDEGFTVGLILLPFIFYPLLGLSKAKYMDGPGAIE